jgi:hypothetical protein
VFQVFLEELDGRKKAQKAQKEESEGIGSLNLGLFLRIFATLCG